MKGHSVFNSHPVFSEKDIAPVQSAGVEHIHVGTMSQSGNGGLKMTYSIVDICANRRKKANTYHSWWQIRIDWVEWHFSMPEMESSQEGEILEPDYVHAASKANGQRDCSFSNVQITESKRVK